MTDVVIIGAGIVGLAAASALLDRAPDLKIRILEKEDGPARHQTGRNSGVIHAGLYYKPGGLKARYCAEGVRRTIDFCERHGVAYEQCGKLVVASNANELGPLAEIERRATANGVPVTRIAAEAITEMEPKVVGAGALFSPRTGICDYGALCAALVADLRTRGVDIRFNTPLLAARETGDAVVAATQADEVQAKTLVSCAGLAADRVAAFFGLADDFRIIPFRGEYHRLADRFTNYTRRLIYPVPDPRFPFLGVHLTKMIGGFTTVGPNAVLSFGRETYARNRLAGRDLASTLAFPGFWRLAAARWRSGLYEMAGSLSKRIYVARCRKYCPELEVGDLQPYPTGVRAQAVTRDGALVDDFLLKSSRRSLHVCNAPSPAATAAFPIGDAIAEQIFARLGDRLGAAAA